MEITEELLDRSEQIQERFHALINTIIKKKPKASYEDMYKTVISLKLAELELKIEELQKQKPTDHGRGEKPQRGISIAHVGYGKITMISTLHRVLEQQSLQGSADMIIIDDGATQMGDLKTAMNVEITPSGLVQRPEMVISLTNPYERMVDYKSTVLVKDQIHLHSKSWKNTAAKQKRTSQKSKR